EDVASCGVSVDAGATCTSCRNRARSDRDVAFPCAGDNGDRVSTGQNDFVSADRDGPVAPGSDPVTSLASHLNCAGSDGDCAVSTFGERDNTAMLCAIAIGPDCLLVAGTGHKDGADIDGEIAVAVQFSTNPVSIVTVGRDCFARDFN